jgi:hypothetical protein
MGCGWSLEGHRFSLPPGPSQPRCGCAYSHGCKLGSCRHPAGDVSSPTAYIKSIAAQTANMSWPSRAHHDSQQCRSTKCQQPTSAFTLYASHSYGCACRPHQVLLNYRQPHKPAMSTHSTPSQGQASFSICPKAQTCCCCCLCGHRCHFHSSRQSLTTTVSCPGAWAPLKRHRLQPRYGSACCACRAPAGAVSSPIALAHGHHLLTSS